MTDEDRPKAKEPIALSAAMAVSSGGPVGRNDRSGIVGQGDESSRRPRTDRDLVTAVVADHDEGAYAELYRRHHRSIAAVTRMILGGGPGCDDVVADVFVDFWLSPEKFVPERGSLLGYLRMKARGHSLDLLRSEAKRRRREDGDLYAGRGPGADIDTAMLASETAVSLRQALTSLPFGEAEAIKLAFFVGMSYTAVARQLGLAEGTVKSRVRNGLRRLRANREVQLHHGDDWSILEDPRGSTKSVPANGLRPT